MATTLKLVFKNADGGNTTFSYAHAKENATDNNVKALVNGIITNSAFFEAKPVSPVSAKLVTTTETQINLGE